MELLHERRQHPVGQGFFHSGQIQLDSTVFSYVYDCGSENTEALMREVTDFTDRRHEQPELNVLFISHFDSDHVNGLDRLLTLVKTRTVVAPYLEPSEHLMLVADAIESGTLNGNTVQFAADPIRWLGDRGVDSVIFVTGGENEEDSPVESPERPKEPRGDERESLDVPLGLDLQTLARGAARTESSGTATTGTGVRTQALIVPHRIELPLVTRRRVALPWTFLTFVHPEDTRIQRFKDTIRRELKGAPRSSKRWNKHWSKWLVSVVQDRVRRNKLADCYGVIRRDRNLTSMSLYSGPTSNARQDGWLCVPRHVLHLPLRVPREWAQHPDRCHCGWIGTGDSDLRVAERRNAFLGHYRGVRELVSTVTAPHHGSHHNLGAELVDRLNCLYVASAGTDNRYGHPHLDVRDMIKSRRRRLKIVTENPDSSLVERFRLIRLPQ